MIVWQQRMNECVLGWTGGTRVYSLALCCRCRLHDPDQNKVLVEDEWVTLQCTFLFYKCTLVYTRVISTG